MNRDWIKLYETVGRLEKIDPDLRKLKNGMFATLFKIDGSDEHYVCFAYSVSGMPTFQINSSDCPTIVFTSNYDGDVDFDYIVFMIRMIIYCSKLYLKLNKLGAESFVLCDETKFTYIFTVNKAKISVVLNKVENKIECKISNKSTRMKEVDLNFVKLDDSELNQTVDEIKMICGLMERVSTKSEPARDMPSNPIMVKYTVILNLLDVLIHADGIINILDPATVKVLNDIFSILKE